MQSCYFCHNPHASIICLGCHVARYCSTTCQDKCERIFKHSTQLCPLLRPSSSPLIQETSSLLLGVRIEHNGVTLATPDHIPVYERFKEYILEKGQISPMMDPLPIDELTEKEVQGVQRKVRTSAKGARIQWLKDHQTNAERYAKTVMDLAHRFDFFDPDLETSVADFFELVADACYKLDKNPHFFDPTKPHFYLSLTEQVWYFFASSGHNILLEAYEGEMRRKRFERKRKVDLAELDVLAGELKKYKEQRVSTLTQRLAAADVNIKGLPYELLRLIAYCLPIRDILNFLHVLRNERERVYNVELLTRHIEERDFFDLVIQSPEVGRNSDRLMRKLEAKYEGIGEKAKHNFFDWFLTSSLLVDLRPKTLLRAWWLNMRNSKSRNFAQLASMTSKWMLPNGGNGRPTDILFLYYRTIGWTMTMAFIPATRLKDDPIVIVGANGLRLLSEFSETFNVHQLKMQTSPLSDIELAVAQRIIELNDILRVAGANPNTQRSIEPFVSFFTFLLTSVDPTVTLWASLKGIENQLPPLNFYIYKTDDFTASSRLGAETVEVLANCIKAALRYGARYEFDYNITFSPVPFESDKERRLLPSRLPSFGAAFVEGWFSGVPLRVFGLTNEDMVYSHVAMFDDSDAEDEDVVDDGDVLFF